LLTCQTRFRAMSGHQEQIHEGGKAQNGQYLAGWAGLLHSIPIK
jgi:hypothetical protein